MTVHLDYRGKSRRWQLGEIHRSDRTYTTYLEALERFLRLNFPAWRKPTSSPVLPTTATEPMPLRFINSCAYASVALGSTKKRGAIGRMMSRARVRCQRSRGNAFRSSNDN